ncbi:MAG: cytochrome c maturation protein CcmE [Candidatus Binataceae bacterium]
MRKRWRFLFGAALIAVAIAYLIVAAVRNTAEYYLTVNEVKARQTKLGRQMLRVAGRVKPGTISWDPESLTLAFGLMPPPAQPGVKPVAITDPPTFHVVCRGQPKPDMFAPNRDVIVEGQLAADGTIEARQVLTSCPSKYVPKQPK